MKTTIFLAQTDTTVGFLSQDAQKLARIKKRPNDKPFLQSYADLKTYNRFGRVPAHFKRQVRRSSSTTHVINNNAFRIVKDTDHQKILTKFGWLYSTSANQSGHNFSKNYAQKYAEVIIEDRRGLYEDSPSKIVKLGINKQIKLR